MKRNTILVASLAALAVLNGYLLSAISFVGRAGINLFYTEYKFLRTWWKGGLLVFVAWMTLFIFQSMVNKSVNKATSNIVNAVLLVIATAGLLFSYSDFRNTLSHRWLGERFHLGVYLFWLVWIVISVILLLRKKPLTERATEAQNI